LALGSDGGLLMENPPCCCCPGAAAPPAEAEEMGASARAMLPSGAYLRGRPRFLRIRSPMPSTLAPGAPAPAADCGGAAYSMGAEWWCCSPGAFPDIWSNESRMPPGMNAAGDEAGAACCANGGGGWCWCCGGAIEEGAGGGGG